MSRKNRNNKALHSRPQFEELEPRILYSGDLAPQADAPAEVVVAEEEVLDDTTTQLENPYTVLSEAELETHNSTAEADLVFLDDEGEPTSTETESSASETQQRLELIFIDDSIVNPQSFIDDLTDSEKTNYEVVTLSSSEDGWSQVLDTLGDYENVDAIHFVTHGEDASIKLGNLWVNSENLSEFEDEFRVLALSLSEQADILFYGCDIAQTETGTHLLQTISEWTAADISASTDLTGAAQHNADWELEYIIGAVETPIAFSESLQSEWDGVLNTYTVTNTNDSGAGSLRQAITNANGNGGTDTIDFSLGAGVSTINLASALPDIIGAINIDGSQASVPSVVINGGGTIANGLNMYGGSDGSTIRGLVLQNFTDEAIDLGSSNNTIAGNYIGTNSTGTSAAAGNIGINLFAGSNNTIGGNSAADRNVISGHANNAITVSGTATGTIIQGNYIGTDVTGTADLGNSNQGIWIGTDSNTVGGNGVGEGNLISNNGHGVSISGDSNTVIGNFIGTDVSGTADLGNDWNGVYILNGDNNQIGGSAAGEKNILSGSGINGVLIDGASTGNNLQGNFIGTDITGTADLGNTSNGISIENGATNNTIGGTTAAQRNVISGNDLMGVNIRDAGTDNNIIIGNYIGTDVSGTAGLGNTKAGVRITAGASNNQIGGTNAGEGNTIAFNNDEGIRILNAAADNSLLGNSIYANATLGIDLNNDLVTANDTQDPDTGANNLQNYPLLDFAVINGGNVQITGSLNSTANTDYRIEFFASASADPSGNGEAERFLGEVSVTTDSVGNANIYADLANVVVNGEFVTATATVDLGGGNYGDTSEFAANVVASDDHTPSDITATQTAEGGLSINNDGGTDTYLVSDTSPFSGQSEITIEVQFSIDTPATGLTPLISYADGSNEDELFIGIDSSGEIFFRTSASGSAGYGSVTADSQLLDGEIHSVAVTWENTGGILMFYVDGEQLGLGRNDYQKTTSIDAGGTLAFGQHQTSPGVFDSDDVFSGTLYDIRIFDDVRTAEEIAANYQSTLPYDEANLISNWQFDALSTDGVITESVSGNNLTIAHVSDVAFTTSTPSLGFELDENATTGTIVGSVTATDAEREALIASLLTANTNLVYSAETGKFYEYISTGKDWATALADAQTSTLGGVTGNLVTINSATENQIVVDLLNAQGASQAYIGASDATNEDEWRWLEGGVDAEQFWQGDGSGGSVDGAYSNWDGANPNDNAGQDYAKIFAATGLWDDTNGGSTNKSVVEYDAATVLDSTQALTYTIQSQTVAGAFTIDADSGQITVADGSLLDFETNASHSITVRTTDVDTNTYDKAFTISLTDLLEVSSAPTDLSSGIELNTDGGNDAYLIANDGGAILGGLTQVTLEATVQIDSLSGAWTPLVSYAIPSFSNELALQIKNDGTLAISVTAETSAHNSTNTYIQLFDGGLHHVGVTWDNTSGTVSFYVDGELVETSNGYKTGDVLTGSGALVLGQEQDSVDGGYNSSQNLRGSLHDVRIWNQVRSAEEIALNYQHKLDLTPAEAASIGLAANWQMDGFNGSNEIVDIVSGNNLSVGHATGVGFITSTPVGDLNIDENTPNDTSVGYVVPSDPEAVNDIVSDGLFLEAADPGAFQSYASPSTFGDWTVESGEIELLGSVFADSPLGGRSVDLNETTPGTISQSLTVEAGRQYQVIFALTGNHTGGETTKDVRVSVGGQSEDFSHTDSAAWSTSTPLWDQRSFTFTPDDTTAVLRFQSLDAGVQGAIIADIQVIEIPAAVSTILNNDSTLSYDAGTGKFYQYVGNNDSTWTDAKTAAGNTLINGVGGQLANIESEYENALVHGLIQNEVYLGASDTSTEGDWYWQDNGVDATQIAAGNTPSTTTYTNFNASNPNDSGGQDALVMRTQDGEWDDVLDSVARDYVVEWDASEVLSNYSFSLTNDAGGRFAIDSNTGEVTVADTSLIDYEVATSHDITVQTTDAAGNTYSEVMAIAINNQGGEPAQTLPGAQTVDEDNTITFSSGNSNAIVVSDTSGNDELLQVTLIATNGTLTLSQTTGLSIPGGSDGSASMVLQGSESDLNAGLEGMVFAPTADYNGAANVSVTTAQAATLEGYYSFDASNAIDDSVGVSQNGTLVNNATTTNDATRGEVLLLDGDRDYVNITSVFSNPANVTLAAWVNYSSADVSGGEIITLGNDVAIRVDDSTRGVTAFFYDGSTHQYVDSSISLADGNWHHIAFTFDDTANTQILYIDGVEIASTALSSSISYTGWFPQSRIGTHANDADTGFDFNGKIDDARIYTRALSGDEIAALATDQTSVTGNVSITVDPVNDAPYFTTVPTSDPDTIESSLTGATSVIAVDLDNDGDADLVSTTNAGELRWHENDGSGNFTAGTVITTQEDFAAVQASDFDGDGDIDLVAVNDDSADLNDTLFVFDNQFIGSGSVSFTMTSQEGSGGGEYDGAQDIVIGDIDGDGRDDFVVTYYQSIGNSDIVVFEQNAPGVWTRSYVDAVNNNYGIDLADMDGDGDLDIVAGDFQDGEIRWYQNNGAATAGFTRSTIISTPSVFDVAVDDIDNDGDQDIVYVNWGTDDVGWLANSGGGSPTFTSHLIESGAANLMYHIELADVNGDGNVDLIVPDKNADEVHLYENDGSGNFTKSVIDDSTNGPVWIDTADLDGDGNEDIIFASQLGGSIGVHSNQGGSTWVVGSVNEDISLGGLQLQVADDDISAGELEVTITVTNGNIILPTGGVTVTAGASSSSTITFTGNVAAVNTAMNSMTYSPSADFYGLGEVQVVVDDQGNTGGPAETTTETFYVEVLPVNDAPVIAFGAGALAYLETDLATVMDATATVSDADSLDFDGGVLDVRITANGEATDRIGINNEGMGAGQVGVTSVPAEVFYGGTLIATWSGNDPLLITFNASADATAVEAVMQNITFRNLSEAPSELTRTVQFSLTDGDGGTSNLLNKSVTVAGVNDAPTFSNLDGTPTFIEDGATVVLDADVTLSDYELSAIDNFNGATLTLVRNGGANLDDVFSESGLLAALTEGGNLVYSGTTIGAVTTNSAGTLLLTFNNNATNALVNSTLQTIAYSNTNQDPSASVQIDWTFDDGNSGAQGSGGALTATGNTTVTITSVNDPAVAVNDSDSTPENTPVIIDLTGNDTDPDSAPLYVLDLSNPANGTVVNNNDGTVTYTPDTNYNGADSFTYTVSDYANLTSQWRLDGDATDSVGSNDGTVVGATTVEGAQGDALSFDEVDDHVVIPDFAIGNEFSLSFQLKIDDNTGSLFQYIYSHGDVNNAGSLNIFLNEDTHGTDPNKLRTVIRDTNDALDNTALEFDASSIIGDSQWHTYTLTIESGVGAKVYLDGVLQNSDSTGGDAFDPTTDLFLGARQDLDANRRFGGELDSVLLFDKTLSASEVADVHSGGSSQGTVNITVTAVNTAPTAANNTVTTSEDTTYTFVAADFGFADVDGGDTLNSIEITSLESVGALQLSGVDVTLNQVITKANIDAGNLTFVPVANANGAGYDNFSFSVNDGALDSASSYTMTVDVTAVNDSPTVATNTGATVAEASTGNTITTVMLNVGDIDDSGSGLTYTVTTDVVNGTLKLSGVAIGLSDTFTQADVDGGLVTYDHDGTQTSSDSFDFSLADGGEDGATAATGTFNFTVTNVNDAPVNTVPAAQSVDEDTSLAIAGISIADTDDNLDTVKLTVSDGILNVTLQGAASVSAGANGSADLTLSGTLTDINNTLATLSYQGDLNFNGSDTLTVLSTDLDAATDSDTVAITVNAVNDDPVNTVPASIAVTEDVATSLTGISIADVDAGVSAMLVTLSVPTGSLAASSSGGVTVGGTASALTLTGSVTDINTFIAASNITYTTAANANGSVTLTVLTSDQGNTGSGGTLNDSDTVALNITAVNDSPTVATNTGATVAEASTGNTITTLMLNEGDVDDAGAGLTYTITTDVVNGTLKLSGVAVGLSDTFTQADIDGGLVTYDHDGSQTNSDSFDFSLADGGENGATSATGTFNFTVTNVNDAPVNTVPGAQTVDEDTSLAIGGISVSDTDGDLDTVQLSVSNGLLNVTLQGAASISAGSNASASLTLSGSQTDINATLATLSYQGNLNFNGSDTLTVLSTDGNTATDSDTITITVDPVNDVPTASNFNAIAGISSIYVFQASDFQFSDVDSGDTLQNVRISNITGSGDLKYSGSTVTNNQLISKADIDAGLLTFTPVTGQSGSAYATFDFEVQDGTAFASSTSSMTIDVSGLTPFYSNRVQGGGIAVDTMGMRSIAQFSGGSLTPTLIISGVPASGSVVAAYLLVSELDFGAIDTSFTLNGTGITASLVGESPDSGWFSSRSVTLAADVTALVTGNGSYTLGGTGDLGADDYQGATLVVVYQDTSVATDALITLHQGSVSHRFSDTAVPLELNGGSAIGQAFTQADLTLASLDGQDSFTEAQVQFQSSTAGSPTSIIAANSFGSDLGGGEQFTTDITGLLTTADSGATLSQSGSGVGADYLIYSFAGVVIQLDNTAPVLDNTGSAAFTGITEDQTGNNGNTVAEILSSAGGDRLTDADQGAIEGIAVTSLSNGNGSWEYSTNNGSTWSSVGSVSDASALLLRDIDRLRFIPNTLTATSASVDFRGWDQTSGSTGTKVDASSNGGTTAFSTVTETASITVSEINDEESLDTNAGLTLNEGATATVTAAMLSTSDVDHAATAVVYTVDVIPVNGTLKLSGVTLINTNTFTQDDIDNNRITYVHFGTETTSDSFDFTVDDGTGSSSSATFNIAVTLQNENAPVVTAAQTFSVSELAANSFSLGNAVATDVDTGTTMSSWTITGGNTGSVFAIDGTTGEITVADNTALDFDTTANYTLSLTVSDGTNTSAVETVSITVTDVATAITAAQSFSIAETAADNSAVGSVVTTGDAPKTFSITGGNTGTAFAIDNSGNITVADTSAIDYETLTSYTLTIQTSDGTTPVSETVTINITDVNENAVSAISNTNGAIESVAENASVGTAVGVTAFATDTDVSDTVTYSLSDNAGGRFIIDSNSGVVTVNAALDAESATSHSITVLATSTDTSTSSQSYTITVTDVDEFDVGAVSDSDAAVNTVAENATVGATVGITASASDMDVDDDITYSLSNDAGGLFAIDGSTGVVTVASALDYESATSHNITVLATSDDTSTSSQVFSIAVTDANDNAPVITAAQTFSVSELAANGFSLGNAVATDIDTGTTLSARTITGGNTGSAFAIDGSTGEITVADNTALDFDTTSLYTLSLTVSDGTNTSAVETVSITVSDVATTITAAQSFSIAESATNASAVGSVVTTGDTPKTFSITGGNTGTAFAIDNSGNITVADASAIDYETLASYTLTIQASDGTTPVSETVTVTITDVNENTVGAISDSNAALDSVAENAVVGTTVGITALATDADGTDTVTYSLSDNAGGRFAIDTNTGVVTVNGALDAESATSYSITVLATSTDASTSSQSYTITVTDVDEFDVGAVTDSNATTNAVAENATVGTSVGITANASDADGSLNTISYSLSDDAGGRFNIDSNSGIVTVAGNLDYEANTSHNITVLATSADSSTSSATFTVQVNPLNDNGAVISDQSLSLSEDANVGSALFDFDDGVSGSDLDADGDALSYSLIAGNDDGLFAIDSVSGVVTLVDASALDYESTASYILQVQASDGSFTSSAQLTIQISNVNEAPIVSAPGSVSVDEDIALSIGNITVSDPDSGSLDIEVTVTSTHGVMSLGDQSSLSSMPVSDGLNNFVLTGSASAINQALAGLEFNPDANFNGEASVSVIANDLGNLGSGSALSDSETITITVIPVNDEPALDVPDLVEILPGESINFSTALDNLAPLQDLDSSNTTHNLSLSIENATLSISDDALLSSITLNDGFNLEASGDIATINEILNALVITPEVGFSGDLILDLYLEDEGSIEVGSTRTLSTQVHLYVPEPPIPQDDDKGLEQNNNDADDAVFIEIEESSLRADRDKDLHLQLDTGFYLPELVFDMNLGAQGEVVADKTSWEDYLDTQNDQSLILSKGLINRIEFNPFEWHSLSHDINEMESLQFTPSLKSFISDLNNDSVNNEISLGVRIAEISGVGFVVGSVVWLLKGSSLLSSLLVSYPAWRGMDPLPVLLPKDSDTDADDASPEPNEKPKNPRFQLLEQSDQQQ